jgi:lysophospholipase L1-like esterase
VDNPKLSGGVVVLRQRRSRSQVALQAAAYGGGAVGTVVGVGAAFWGLVKAEAKHARNTIGEPTETPPHVSGSWGYGRRGTTPLRFAVIGDSSAAGLGARTPEETPAGRLAGGLARELHRRVIVDVVAVVGARSQDLDAQVARALQQPVDIAMIMIGANDVTHRVSTSEASRDLGRAVATLREAGTQVVVGTCPDLGTVEPLLQPLKTVAAKLSRHLARGQSVAVAEAGGTSVSLGDLLADEFHTQRELWSADRFHPSSSGYARVADVLLPVFLDVLGQPAAGTVTVRDSVQHVSVAALQAARDPGLAIEAVEGSSSAASAGPGRLVRLVRRVPLVGRGAPEGRTTDEQDATETEALPAEGKSAADTLVTDK